MRVVEFECDLCGLREPETDEDRLPRGWGQLPEPFGDEFGCGPCLSDARRHVLAAVRAARSDGYQRKALRVGGPSTAPGFEAVPKTPQVVADFEEMIGSKVAPRCGEAFRYAAGGPIGTCNLPSGHECAHAEVRKT